MNTDTMLNVAMSALFFAPLLIGLVFFLFIGALVTFEGVVTFASRYATQAPKPAGVPAEVTVGELGEALQESIRGEATDAAVASDDKSKVSNG